MGVSSFFIWEVWYGNGISDEGAVSDHPGGEGAGPPSGRAYTADDGENRQGKRYPKYNF